MLTPEVSKERVEHFLDDHFTSLEQDASQQGEAYQRTIRIAHDVALNGGKRLRPYMSMLIYEAYSGQSGDSILPVAAAQEVMHLAMLVHDDIMDGDTTRHGQLNVTGRALEVYAPLIEDKDERRRRAEHVALLMGDLLVGEAYALTDDVDGIDPKTMSKARRLFRTATRTVVGGQLNDAEAPFVGAQAVSPRQIAHDKTAHYSFVTPLLVGATLAEAPQAELDKLKEIGEKTGIAYQLRDDILGVFGNPAVTGKSADGDLREGKRTLLTEVFEQTSSYAQRQQFELLRQTILGRPGEAAQFKRMRQLLKPAQRIVEHEIDTTRSEVSRLIGGLAIESDYRNALGRLSSRSLSRNY